MTVAKKIIDLFVHHNDMPWLPGNLGNFPLLGFGVWDFEYAVFGTEVLMAVIGIALYFRWAHAERPTRSRFVGPIILTPMFMALAAVDFGTLSGAG